MIALRLVRLIEDHSEELAEALLTKLERSSRVAALFRVHGQEIRERSREIYRNLSDWLLTKTEEDIERVYVAVGRRRAEQGVPLSAVCWGINMTEENLWDFLEMEGMRERPLEILGGFELLRLMDQFFDQAIYYATVGYESYWNEKETHEPQHLAHTA